MVFSNKNSKKCLMFFFAVVALFIKLENVLFQNILKLEQIFMEVLLDLLSKKKLMNMIKSLQKIKKCLCFKTFLKSFKV